MSVESKASRKIAQGAMRRATSGPTVADLRAQAKVKKIKGYSKMTKAQLMKALSAPSASVGPSKVVSPKKSSPTKTASPQKTSGDESSSKALHNFIEKTWENIWDLDMSALSKGSVAKLEKPMVEFLAKKLVRFIKHVGGKSKTYASFTKALDHFESHGIGVTDPLMKKDIKMSAMMGAETAVLLAYKRFEMVDGATGEDLREWMEDFSIRQDMVDYVRSMVPHLEKNPKDRDSIVFHLISVMQTGVESLKDAAVKHKPSNNRHSVEVITLTRESIQKKISRNNPDIALFFS